MATDAAHPAPAAAKEEKKPPPPAAKGAIEKVTEKAWIIIIIAFIIGIAFAFGGELMKLIWDGIILTIQNLFTGSAVAVDSTRVGLHNNNIAGIGLILELRQSLNLWISVFFIVFFIVIIPYVAWKMYQEHKAKQKPH